MTKIRVVIATNSMGLGGAERTVQTLALRLNREDFDVSVLCLESGGPRVSLLQEHGVRVDIGDGTIEGIRRIWPDPTLSRIDILHFHRSGHHESLHNDVIEYLKPKKIMETNVFAFHDSSLASRFDMQVYKSMMMLTERVWKGKIPFGDWWKKQRVIYNPVRVDQFHQFRISPEERSDLRAVYHFSQDDIVIGRIGRADPVKWGDLILSALPTIKKVCPRVKVLFQTVPPNRLTWLTKKGYIGDGTVVVLPETSDERELAKTYQLLDIYVHTSRRGEAFGNTLNEAMVWSLPIIVENTPHWDNGQLEQVRHERTGLVVKTVSGLVAAIKRFTEDKKEREEFGHKGHIHVRNDFAEQIGVGEYESTYQFLMGERDLHVFKEGMTPKYADIISFVDTYSNMKKYDVSSSSFRFTDEIRRHVEYIFWRIKDSLTARGILS